MSATVAREGLRIAIECHVSGVLHLGGKERLARYAFGALLCQVWGFDPGLLQPVTRSALNFTAARPADTFLDCRRAWALGYDAPPLEEQLRTLKAEGRIS